jgi:hypothetical protein
VPLLENNEKGGSMDPLSVGIGLAAIAFGCITFYMRTKNPAKFAKLEAMKARFGETVGLLVHTVAYSLVPIGFGVVAVLLGMNGRSIFG